MLQNRVRLHQLDHERGVARKDVIVGTCALSDAWINNMSGVTERTDSGEDSVDH